MSRPYASESSFRAIADPTRRRIIELLLVANRQGFELSRELKVTAQTLSHHLSILRTAGLISQRRIGRTREYQVHTNPLQVPMAWLRKCRV